MSIMGTIQEAQRDANRANLQRYQEGLGLYDQMIKGWKKGGGFAKGAKAGLARARTKSMASGMQSLASSGLAGTTMAAGLGKKWEEEVGTPARLSIADIAGQRLMQARQAKAGFIERREDYGPDPGMISQSMQQIGRGSGGSVSQPQGSTRPSPYQPTFGPTDIWGRPVAGGPWGGRGFRDPSVGIGDRRPQTSFSQLSKRASDPWSIGFRG